jgi:hypothetical protein
LTEALSASLAWIARTCGNRSTNSSSRPASPSLCDTLLESFCFLRRGASSSHASSSASTAASFARSKVVPSVTAALPSGVCWRYIAAPPAISVLLSPSKPRWSTSLRFFPCSTRATGISATVISAPEVAAGADTCCIFEAPLNEAPAASCA